MKRLLMVALVGLVVSGPAWGIGKGGAYTGYSQHSCGFYLDAYASAELIGDHLYSGTYKTSIVFGWINGYLTAYNRHVDTGEINILGTMPMNDARRWMASWCRDNPSKDVLDALAELLLTR